MGNYLQIVKRCDIMNKDNQYGMNIFRTNRRRMSSKLLKLGADKCILCSEACCGCDICVSRYEWEQREEEVECLI